MHLSPHSRVDAVGADQQRAVRLGRRAVGAFDQRSDGAVSILAVAGDAVAEPDSVAPGPLDQLVVHQHVEAAAVHGVLRPLITGEQAARLRVDVVAVQPYQRPFFGGQAHAIEVGLRDAEIVNLAHSVRLQIDAYAERAHLAHRFEYDARHADLVEGKRRCQPANAAAGDNY